MSDHEWCMFCRTAYQYDVSAECVTVIVEAGLLFETACITNSSPSIIEALIRTGIKAFNRRGLLSLRFLASSFLFKVTLSFSESCPYAGHDVLVPFLFVLGSVKLDSSCFSEV